MRKLPFFCLAALAFLPAGCSSLLFKPSKSPELYQAPYTPRVVSCPRQFSQGVRVWEFTAAPPYDRPEMVVRKGNQEVLLSGDNQWIAMPAAIVTEHLYQDLVRGLLFGRVVTGATPLKAPLAITGRVFAFEWENEGATSRAVLKVEATLAGDGDREATYFHRVYTLASDQLRENTPAAFAKAMGNVLGDFSQRLQTDLCTMLTPQGSPPATR